MKPLKRNLQLICAATAMFWAVFAASETPTPKPPGTLVELGDHKLHVSCSGHGSPTVVVETGLGDFSFDWTLVQTRVARSTRICTYDRAGYAWSEPGPKPRTFAQLNLELHDALQKLGERGPFVLVGHSFGGPAVRNFAAVYPNDVAGIVLVDSASEGMRVSVGGKKTVRLGDGVKVREIPAPREEMSQSEKSTAPVAGQASDPPDLDPIYKSLPSQEQKMHLWAQNLPALAETENNQREWSEIYFAKWLEKPQTGTLGKLPLVVLTRAEGGYGDDLDVPAAQIEQERKDGQAKLAQLSTNSRQVFIRTGHNMEVEAPAAVTTAIHEVVEAVRRQRPLAVE